MTVLLETASVLESVYDLSTDETVKALQRLLGLPDVRAEDPGAIAAAIDAEFVTLDRALAKRSKRLRAVRRA